MARSVVVYPSANIVSNHGPSGYSRISDQRGSYDTTAVTHSLTYNNTTTISSSYRCNVKSGDSDAPVGKFIINSVNGAQSYTRLVATNARSQRASITIASSISGSAWKSAASKSFTASQSAFTTSVYTISGLTGSRNRIYNSMTDADIRLQMTTQGTYVTDSKNSSATFSISAVNLDVNYSDVYTCKAVVVEGYGITSATPATDTDVIDGDTCSFSANLSSGTRFVGWYENSDFSGTPVTTSRTFSTTVTENLTLYPKGQLPYPIQIFSDSAMAGKFSYTIKVNGSTASSAFEGDSVVVTVTVLDELYEFAGIYEADSEGYKLDTQLSSTATYSFTMEAAPKYMYVVLGKEIRIYVDCQNCSMVGRTSPIRTVTGRTETINFTYDSTSYDWSGIYSDARYSNRITQAQSYTFLVGSNDEYLYARAIGKQQIYLKENGTWQTYTEVYVKENGTWVKKSDFRDVFDTSKRYRKLEV